MYSRWNGPVTGVQTEGRASRGHQLPNIWKVRTRKERNFKFILKLEMLSVLVHSALSPLLQGPSGCFCDVDVVSFLMRTCAYSPVCTLLAWLLWFLGPWFIARFLFTLWISLLMAQFCSITECNRSARDVAKNRRALREPRIPHQMVFQVFFRTR